MINEILQNLINTGEVVSFINDILVGTEKEKEYDKVVEEIVKRLVESDLYIKLKKCKWKVREVGFLGIVIGPDRIKMEEEKMKTVLDWLASKKIKNVQKFLKLANYYRQFVRDFTTIARPLYDLIKKEQKWR